jgi:hypothetical protein
MFSGSSDGCHNLVTARKSGFTGVWIQYHQPVTQATTGCDVLLTTTQLHADNSPLIAVTESDHSSLAIVSLAIEKSA